MIKLDLEFNYYYELNDANGIVEIKKTDFNQAKKENQTLVACIYLQYKNEREIISYELKNNWPNEVKFDRLKTIRVMYECDPHVSYN